MLGHRAQVTTAIYARLDVNPVRIAAERAVDAMLEAGGVTMIEGHSEPATKEDDENENPK